MRIKIAIAGAIVVSLLLLSACAPVSSPPSLSTPPPVPSPTPCAPMTAAVSSGVATSTFASPVYASPLPFQPTLSPDELATREAAMQHANPGAPTTAPSMVTALPPCSTPTPLAPAAPSTTQSPPSGG